MKQLEWRFAGVSDEVHGGIELVSSEIGIQMTETRMKVELIRSARSDLLVKYDGAQAMIMYSCPHHLYRGIGLLAEALGTGKRFELREEPQFDKVGFMLDCSRNAVPTVDSVKALLRRMAAGCRLLHYVNENYTASDLSLKKLAELFQMSVSGVSKLFKEVTGINFYDYLCRLRMETAKELLRDKNSVDNVAHRVGYENVYSFKRAFVRYEGIKPDEYAQLGE